MAEASDALSVIIGALRAVFSYIWGIQWSWYASKLTRLFTIPINIALVPLSYVSEALAVIFAPVVYLFAYSVAIASWITSFLASLKPLYSFLSAAAGVGIIAGITLGIASSLVTSYLGMQDDGEGDGYFDEDQKLLKSRNHREQQLFKRAFANAASRNGSNVAAHDGDSSSDAEWRQWADSPSRRRKPAGLLSQTIHEEDDDSEV